MHDEGLARSQRAAAFFRLGPQYGAAAGCPRRGRTHRNCGRCRPWWRRRFAELAVHAGTNADAHADAIAESDPDPDGDPHGQSNGNRYADDRTHVHADGNG
jgi:hypothetical protein